MNWYKAVRLAQFSWPYGYWLAPDGTRHTVGFQAHSEVAWQLGLRDYKGAWEAGYYRIMTGTDGYSRDLECGCSGKKPVTTEQAREMIAIFTKETPCETIYTDLPGFSTELSPLKFRNIIMAKATPYVPPQPDPAKVERQRQDDKKLLDELEEGLKEYKQPPANNADVAKKAPQMPMPIDRNQARQMARQRANPNLQRAR